MLQPREAKSNGLIEAPGALGKARDYLCHWSAGARILLRIQPVQPARNVGESLSRERLRDLLPHLPALDQLFSADDHRPRFKDVHESCDLNATAPVTKTKRQGGVSRNFYCDNASEFWQVAAKS